MGKFKAKMSKSSLIKLYKLLEKADKLKLFYVIFLMLLNAVLEMLGVGAIPGLILLIASPESLAKVPYIGDTLLSWHGAAPQVFFIGVVLVLFFVFIFKNAFFVYLTFVNSTIVRNFQVKMSNKMFNMYLNAPYSFHLQSDHAALLRNVNGEINLVVTQVLMPALVFLLDVFIAASILTVLFFVEPFVSLMSFVILGIVSALFLKLTKKKVLHYGREAKKLRKRKMSFLMNSLNLIKEIKILGIESFFAQKFLNSEKKQAYYSLHKEVFSKVPKAILEVSALGLILGIILVLLKQGRNMDEMVAILALFAVAAVRLMPVISKISTSVTSIRYSLTSVDLIHKELTTVKEENMGANGSFQTLGIGSINFERVCFSYDTEKREVLNNVSIQLPFGKSIAFVGPSGAGKSTLSDLLMGLLVQTDGTITCNGKDIRDNLRSWRDGIGYVPQQIVLINDTLLANICLGIPTNLVNYDRVQRVIEEVQLAELLESLPDGLNTNLGEKGVKISGGQRQRVGIARALYNDPHILVLDEATSALDSITEKYVMEAVNSLKGARTIIMIAHRLSTVKECDVIFYMEGGHVLDEGSYEELLARNSEFQKLVASSHA